MFINYRPIGEISPNPVTLSQNLDYLETTFETFFNYSFWVHHPVNWDARHLLAHAMASDFSVAWKCLSKITIDFSLPIKLHALIRLRELRLKLETLAFQ
jgi:hypothetical protein